MARGFILGSLTGTVIAAGVGTLASVLAPAPQRDGLQIVGTSARVTFDGPDLIAEPVLLVPAPESPAPASPSSVLGATPALDTLAALDMEATRPPPRADRGPTEVFSTADALEVPNALAADGGITVAIDDPVTRNAQSFSLYLPDTSMQAFRPAAGVEQPAQRPEPTPVALKGTANSDPAATLAQSNVLAVLQRAPTQPETPTQVEGVAIAIPVAIADVIRSTTVAPRPPQTLVIAQAAPIESDLPEQPQVQQTQVQAPDAMAVPAVTTVAPAARPLIGKPAISLTERNTGVVVNRLGTAATAETTQVAQATAPEAEQATVVEDVDDRPIAQFSQPFENPENKPLMSVVLIDNGTTAIGEGDALAQLRDFPYALSFAVDSALPDAAERIAMYRNEGFEVLSMIDLPVGARPTDAETTLGAILPQMGEIVGVLEGDSTGFQETREVSDQINLILAQSGHGLVAQAKGLNTMPNLARKEGVPAAAVFRDFDSKGQDARVIRRFLDQAAFKAAQEGAVIMLGRLREETISALLLWGLQDRAGQVGLAPISAVLLRDSS